MRLEYRALVIIRRANFVLILTFLMIVFHEMCLGAVQLVRVVRRQPMSNLLCDGNEKWTIQKVQSAVECALLCNRDSRRRGIFYNTNTRTCHCRGSGQIASSCMVEDSTEFYSFVKCDNGYIPFEEGNFCYKIRYDCTNSWQQAFDNCEEEEGSLVSLWDDIASAYAQALAQDFGSDADCGYFWGVWIGFREVNGTLKWLDDDTPVDLTKHWGTNEPSGGEPCGALWRDAGFLYNDVGCTTGSWNLIYICSQQ